MRATNIKIWSRSLQLGRIERALLFAGAMVWFLAIATSLQRNDQDIWILDGLLVPALLFAGVSMLVMFMENDNRFVALYAVFTVLTLSMIPALKYVQPYGYTIDATIHFQMVQALMQKGKVIAPHTYERIPAMHAWLASLGLMAQQSAQWAIKFGPALMGAMMPLLLYWMGKHLALSVKLVKYILLASTLSAFSYYSPNGTGYTLVPLFALLCVLVAREYDPSLRGKRTTLAVIAFTIIVQLVLWHSSVPLLLPLMLLVASLSPMFLSIIRGEERKFMVNRSFLTFAALAAVVYLAYHYVVADPVWQEVVFIIGRSFQAERSIKALVPEKAFEVQTLDLIKVVVISFGQELTTYSLMVIGVVAVWIERKRWSAYMPFFVFFFLILLANAAVMLVAVLRGVPYQRFLLIPMAISPIFAGAAFLWGMRALAGRFTSRWPAKAMILSVVLIAIILWGLDYYPYQPLVPQVKTSENQTRADYLVWFQEVNTAYQERMLEFAQNKTDPVALFATDLVGQKQFLRYFGAEAGVRRGLYLPLYRQEPINPMEVGYVLLHWPGPAGGLGEKVDYRSISELEQLIGRMGHSLIYDNGESFILRVDPIQQEMK